MSVEAPVNLQGPADERRAVGAPHARRRVESADQDGMRHALRAGDEVEAMVQAVDEVDVGASRRAEHGLGAPGPPATGGVRRLVLRPQVGLDLDEAPAEGASTHLTDEDLAEKVSSYVEGVSGEEARGEDA